MIHTSSVRKASSDLTLADLFLKENLTHRFYVSLETPLETPKIFIDIFGKDTAFSHFRYLSCAIPLPLVAIKIVNKHKVVCAQNLMSYPILLYKQYKFCEEQKGLTDEFKAKYILYLFPRCFQKVQTILTKMSNFPTTCHRETSQPQPLPPPKLILREKLICEASLSLDTHGVSRCL